jgi:hypothetical protein
MANHRRRLIDDIDAQMAAQEGTDEHELSRNPAH